MQVQAQFFRYNVRYEPLDPINVVFRGSQPASDLLTAILNVLDDAEWRQDMQSHLYLLEGTNRLRHERAWRTLGPPWERYHVRFWLGDGEVLGSAHLERITLWPPGHKVESFDAGKRRLEDVFRQAGWAVHRDFLDLTPLVSPIDDPAASGRASLIEP